MRLGVVPSNSTDTAREEPSERGRPPHQAQSISSVAFRDHGGPTRTSAARPRGRDGEILVSTHCETPSRSFAPVLRTLLWAQEYDGGRPGNTPSEHWSKYVSL